MNRTSIDVQKLIELLEIYMKKDGTLTVHMVEKLLYHLTNHGDVESVQVGAE